MSKAGLGNPQLGVADPTKLLPKYVEITGKIDYPQICGDCGGYYMAQCPCWFRKGGRHYPTNNPLREKKWWQFWIKDGKS
mgnify:CR=1 FL=1